jgi:hypothetical protein
MEALLEDLPIVKVGLRALVEVDFTGRAQDILASGGALTFADFMSRARGKVVRMGQAYIVDETTVTRAEIAIGFECMFVAFVELQDGILLETLLACADSPADAIMAYETLLALLTTCDCAQVKLCGPAEPSLLPVSAFALVPQLITQCHNLCWLTLDMFTLDEDTSHALDTAGRADLLVELHDFEFAD